MANTVTLGYEYFPDPTKGRPVFNGSIYVGIPDGDPANVPGDRKDISVVQEDGTVIPVSQPVNTGAGGVPLYNGSPVRIQADGSYSLAVLDKSGSQVYYNSNSQGIISASDVSFTPTGDIEADNVQDAIEELDAEKQSKSYTAPGSGAVERTVEDKLAETFSTKDFGAVGDGVADDTAALQAWLASGGGKLTAVGGDVYRFTGQLLIPAGSIVETNGCIFESAYSVVGNASAVVVGENAVVDELNVNLLTGFTVERFVSISDGSRVGAIRTESADQINNRGDSLDAAVQVRGSNSEVELIYTKNFDNGVLVYDDSDIVIGTVICESYVRGLHTREVTNLSLTKVKCYTASPNATQDPGHNGVLISQLVDSSIDNIEVTESGEHGVRIGSGITGPTRDLTIGIMKVTRPGQCGFKINDDSFATVNVTVGEIQTVDCAFGNATGSNEDPVRLEKCNRITIGSISGFNDTKANCGNDGVHINACAAIYIGDVYLENPLANGFNIVDTSGQCRDIHVGQYKLAATAGLGINIDMTTENLRHVMFMSGYFRDVPPDTPCIVVNTGGGAQDPNIFRISVDVTGWSSPGAVTPGDLLDNVTGAGRVYNECQPYN